MFEDFFIIIESHVKNKKNPLLTNENKLNQIKLVLFFIVNDFWTVNFQIGANPSGLKVQVVAIESIDPDFSLLTLYIDLDYMQL